MRGELRSIRNAVERSESELRRATTDGEALRARLDQLAAEADRLRADCASAESVETPLVAEVEAGRDRRGVWPRSPSSAVTHARHDASEAASRANARVEALQLALDAAHARAGAERLAGVDGVLGTLLDLVEIDDGWEPAVEAALGEALTAVVVDGDADPPGGRSPRCATRTRAAPCSPLGARSVAPHPPPVGDAVRTARPLRPPRHVEPARRAARAAPCGSTESTPRSTPRSPIRQP